MNDEGIEIYYATRTNNRYEWRFTLHFSDGGSIRIYAAVRYWDWFPLNEIIERVIDFHGTSEQYIIGMRLHRYQGGARVS
jgi:hypothetical protein